MCLFYKTPKEQPFCFIKSLVVPLYFGFDSLGNEQNFLFNQKAGKLMNVTRNKLFNIGGIGFRV